LIGLLSQTYRTKKLQDFIWVPSVFKLVWLDHIRGLGTGDGKGKRNLMLLYELMHVSWEATVWEGLKQSRYVEHRQRKTTTRKVTSSDVVIEYRLFIG
jgi:hypothetical protein